MPLLCKQVEEQEASVSSAPRVNGLYSGARFPFTHLNAGASSNCCAPGNHRVPHANYHVESVQLCEVDKTLTSVLCSYSARRGHPWYVNLVKSGPKYTKYTSLAVLLCSCVKRVVEWNTGYIVPDGWLVLTGLPLARLTFYFFKGIGCAFTTNCAVSRIPIKCMCVNKAILVSFNKGAARNILIIHLRLHSLLCYWSADTVSYPKCNEDFTPKGYSSIWVGLSHCTTSLAIQEHKANL